MNNTTVSPTPLKTILDNVLAEEIMTKSLLTARHSWTVMELAQFLVSNGITGAPVINDNEQLLGVVSVTDVTRYASMTENQTEERGRHGYYTDNLDSEVQFGLLEEFSDFQGTETTVEDIMTPTVFDVDTKASAALISKEMVTNGIHRVFVSDAGKIVGVVSALDILQIANR